MSSSVGDGSTSVGLTSLAEFERLTSESSLVDFALICSRKWHTKVFELDDGPGCLSTHVVDGILVTEPIGTLDGVVHMPPPVVLGHVTKGCIDTTLGGDSVRTCRE